MKVQTRVVIILIAIILCCSMFGSAFALYSVGASLDISFSGKADEVIEYFLKITENGTDVATQKLSNSTENTSEYTATAYLKSTYKVDFYKNNTLLTNNVDYTYQTGSDVTATTPAPNEFNYSVTYTTSASGKATANIALDRTTYYLVGENNGWDIGEKAIKFVPNPSNPNEVMALGVAFTENQGFKIRNYAGYYNAVKSDTPPLYSFKGNDSKNGDILLNYAESYDFYFDTTANKVYIRISGKSLITSRNNPSWVMDANAKFFAIDASGNSYPITTTKETNNTVTITTLVPDNLGKVNIERRDPITDALWNSTVLVNHTVGRADENGWYKELTFTSNQDWLTDAGAKFIAKDSEGNLYLGKATLNSNKTVTIIIQVPINWDSLTILRCDPNNTNTVWNKAENIAISGLFAGGSITFS